MGYKQIVIPVDHAEQREILIALLAETGIEGFEERDTELVAFVENSGFSEDAISAVLQPMRLDFSVSDLEKVNWNKEWETHFPPVIITDFCTIYAPFHQLEVQTPFKIVITPKMSFGTGHHATTQLMVKMMQELDFSNTCVLDFGTGTGVLAILARKLGAYAVLAIDNDEWSVGNAKENVVSNHLDRIEVRQGSLELADKQFDIILANINRNILLQYLPQLSSLLKEKGILILSGILSADVEAIEEKALKNHFISERRLQSGEWVALSFEKYTPAI